MRRLLLLLGLSLRIRMRGLLSSGASSIFALIGGLFYLGLTCAMGVGAYYALSASHAMKMQRAGDVVALAVTLFGVLFVTRPLILANLAGGSLQHLLHLPIRRSELLAYSALTGVFVPLLLESPVLMGAALGAASHPTLLLATLPLALLAHLTLLAGAHSMSLLAILMSRRAWIADVARVLAFAVLFFPSFLNFRVVRDTLRPLVGPFVQASPFGWAARAAVYAGAGDIVAGIPYAILAVLSLAGIGFLSLHLLNRILAGEGDRVTRPRGATRRARVLLPGALGALIETQLRTQLRTPAARMALFMPTLMMGLFALSLARSGATTSPYAMVVFLSVVGGNAFLMTGRGIALILGTKVSRAAVLVASDVSAFLFRMPPLLAIIAVTAWQGHAGSTLSMIALALILLGVGMGVQHFVSILRPFSLPRDRLNPFARRADARQSANGFLSLLATLVTALIAAPFLLLLWLSPRVAEGAYEPWLLLLAGLGASAAYAVLIALAERLFIKRELQVLEVLFDDSPG